MVGVAQEMGPGASDALGVTEGWCRLGHGMTQNMLQAECHRVVAHVGGGATVNPPSVLTPPD